MYIITKGRKKVGEQKYFAIKPKNKVMFQLYAVNTLKLSKLKLNLKVMKKIRPKKEENLERGIKKVMQIL